MKGPTVDLRLWIHLDDPKRSPKVIRVSKDGVYRETDENPFLPRSQIEIVEKPRLGPALIKMPRWLAARKGLHP